MSEENFSIHASVGYWVSRLSRAMEYDFEKRLAAHGITRGAWAVLSAIMHDNKTTPSELTSFVGIDGASIARHLNRLEEQGLVVRNHDLPDRRSVKLKLTAKGARLAPRIASDSKATNQKFLNGLNRSEAEQITTIARKMLSNVDAMPRDI